jgi:hypothetical protein
MKRPLSPAQVDWLDTSFRSIIKSGHIEQTGALEGEQEHHELPRLRFHFAKRGFGTLRRMIDRINEMPDDGSVPQA